MVSATSMLEASPPGTCSRATSRARPPADEPAIVGSATGRGRDEGQLSAFVKAILPAGVVLVDGAAQARPEGGQPGRLVPDRRQYRLRGAPLLHLHLDRRSPGQLAGLCEEQHRDVQAGTPLAALPAGWTARASSMGAATSQ